MTALCFINEAREALSEMLRVARRRIALGLLNLFGGKPAGQFSQLAGDDNVYLQLHYEF